MDYKDACEAAYSNGYAAGRRDERNDISRAIGQLVCDTLCTHKANIKDPAELCDIYCCDCVIAEISE